MTNSPSDPIDQGVEETRQRWEDRTSTPARVYLALLETSEYTHYGDIATVASCAPNTAEKYLDWFVEMGLAQGFTESGLFYRRNNAYFEWFEAYNISNQMEESAIVERIDELEDREHEIAHQFDTNDPFTLRVLDPSNDTPDSERLAKISEWQSIRKEIGLYRLAHHLCLNDGYLIGE
jgi:hypothetical protein